MLSKAATTQNAVLKATALQWHFISMAVLEGSHGHDEIEYQEYQNTIKFVKVRVGMLFSLFWIGALKHENCSNNHWQRCHDS